MKVKKGSRGRVIIPKDCMKKIRDYCAISGAERRFITAVELSDADGSFTAIK